MNDTSRTIKRRYKTKAISLTISLGKGLKTNILNFGIT